MSAWLGWVGLFLLLTDIAGTRRTERCKFPEKWDGIWFQSSVRPYITIERSHMSSKGTCFKRKGEKYILKEKKNCFKCVVFHEKHDNVLQYKETFGCFKRDELSSVESVCSYIPGDANLYSMFRVDGSSIPCPLGGPLSFSYNRGKGECAWPESELESCTDRNRLVFQYQACANVQGSEMMADEVECQAHWRDGAYHYLVVKRHHIHATEDEKRYRCYVYEHGDAAEGRVLLAQSGDATCNGLLSPTEGSSTLKMKRGPSKVGCQFPSWMSSLGEWATLDGSLSFYLQPDNNGSSYIDLVNSTLKTNDLATYVVEEQSSVLCHRLEEMLNGTRIIMHQTIGCKSGFVCSHLVRKSDTSISIRLGRMSRNPEYACDSYHYGNAKEYLFVASSSSSSSEDCPFFGLYRISSETPALSVYSSPQRAAGVRADPQDLCTDGSTKKVLTLIVGCGENKADMEMRSSCPDDEEYPKAFTCTDKWEEDGVQYLLLKPKNRASTDVGLGLVCYSFKSNENGVMVMSKLDENCNDRVERNAIGVAESMVLMMEGDCSRVSGDDRPKTTPLILFATFLAVLAG